MNVDLNSETPFPLKGCGKARLAWGAHFFSPWALLTNSTKNLLLELVLLKSSVEDFPGGTMVKNPPARGFLGGAVV